MYKLKLKKLNNNINRGREHLNISSITVESLEIKYLHNFRPLPYVVG